MGLPKVVLSDNGSQFVAKTMEEVARLLSMTQVQSFPYHPMVNVMVEKWNGALKRMLRRICSERQRDWDRCLELFIFVYRGVPQESMNLSHFELLHERTVRGR